jgi:SAM-dependent methyltransferase/ribosomal protein S18 acetylase RimI-like enzyme
MIKSLWSSFAARPVASRWTIGAVLARVPGVWREGGLRHLWFKVLGETVYRRAHLVQCTLTELPPAPAAAMAIEIAPLAEDEVGDYLELRPDADRADILARLAAGQRCVVARHDGHVIHAVWAATGRAWIEYLAREIQLGSGDVYLFEAHSAPAVRGRHIGTLLLACQMRFFRETGCRRALAVVMPENVAALRWVKRAGFRQIGVMGYVKAGPWRRDFSRLRPRGAPPGSVAASASIDWDRTSERFADRPHYLNRFLGELKCGAYLQLIQRWGGLPATGRVLKTDLFEEALGPDALLPALSGNGCVAIGMDVSVALTRRARAREGPGTLRCVAGDSRRLPFADDTFALIVSPSTLDHFSDAVDLSVSLRELARVLEPGGRLIITLDNRQNVFDPLLRLAHRVGWVPYYLGRSYRVTELREELSGAGLGVEATTAILHNPRLVAVAAVRFAANVGWLPLTRIVERTLRGAQRLEDTPLCYFTGSFVAAKALKPMKRATG